MNGKKQFSFSGCRMTKLEKAIAKLPAGTTIQKTFAQNDPKKVVYLISVRRQKGMAWGKTLKTAVMEALKVWVY